MLNQYSFTRLAMQDKQNHQKTIINKQNNELLQPSILKQIDKNIKSSQNNINKKQSLIRNKIKQLLKSKKEVLNFLEEQKQFVTYIEANHGKINQYAKKRAKLSSSLTENHRSRRQIYKKRKRNAVTQLKNINQTINPNNFKEILVYKRLDGENRMNNPSNTVEVIKNTQSVLVYDKRNYQTIGFQHFYIKSLQNQNDCLNQNQKNFQRSKNKRIQILPIRYTSKKQINKLSNQNYTQPYDIQSPKKSLSKNVSLNQIYNQNHQKYSSYITNHTLANFSPWALPKDIIKNQQQFNIQDMIDINEKKVNNTKINSQLFSQKDSNLIEQSGKLKDKKNHIIQNISSHKVNNTFTPHNLNQKNDFNLLRNKKVDSFTTNKKMINEEGFKNPKHKFNQKQSEKITKDYPNISRNQQNLKKQQKQQKNINHLQISKIKQKLDYQKSKGKANNSFEQKKYLNNKDYSQEIILHSKQGAIFYYIAYKKSVNKNSKISQNMPDLADNKVNMIKSSQVLILSNKTQNQVYTDQNEKVNKKSRKSMFNTKNILQRRYPKSQQKINSQTKDTNLSDLNRYNRSKSGIQNNQEKNRQQEIDQQIGQMKKTEQFLKQIVLNKNSISLINKTSSNSKSNLRINQSSNSSKQNIHRNQRQKSSLNSNQSSRIAYLNKRESLDYLNKLASQQNYQTSNISIKQTILMKPSSEKDLVSYFTNNDFPVEQINKEKTLFDHFSNHKDYKNNAPKINKISQYLKINKQAQQFQVEKYSYNGNHGQNYDTAVYDADFIQKKSYQLTQASLNGIYLICKQKLKRQKQNYSRRKKHSLQLKNKKMKTQTNDTKIKQRQLQRKHSVQLDKYGSNICYSKDKSTKNGKGNISGTSNALYEIDNLNKSENNPIKTNSQNNKIRQNRCYNQINDKQNYIKQVKKKQFYQSNNKQNIKIMKQKKQYPIIQNSYSQSFTRITNQNPLTKNLYKKYVSLVQNKF